MSDLISRQAVMDCFKKWQPYMATRLFEFEKELSALPSVTPQSERKPEKCGDCISRKAATDRFDLVQSDDLCMSYDDIMTFLSSLPSVEPERKTGLWMDPEQGICWCSICGCQAEEVSNYCPDCGAQMRPNWKYKGEAQ